VGAYSASADLQAEFKEKERRVGKGTSETLGEAIRGDGKGTDEEKEGHPPHARSPPTFQPCLHPCI